MAIERRVDAVLRARVHLDDLLVQSARRVRRVATRLHKVVQTLAMKVPTCAAALATVAISDICSLAFQALQFRAHPESVCARKQDEQSFCTALRH